MMRVGFSIPMPINLLYNAFFKNTYICDGPEYDTLVSQIIDYIVFCSNENQSV